MSDGIGTVDVKRAVSEGRKVRFTHFRDGELWYETEFGEAFPVQSNDLRGATVFSEMKAVFFMRWMNRWNELLTSRT